MTRILVIDDEAPVRTMLQQVLEKEGYEVDTASDGSMAMRLLEEHPPALVITDILMPEKDGIEVILELRKRAPYVKTIAISGGGRTGRLDFLPEAKSFGALRTLAKPFERQELLEAVRAVLGWPSAVLAFFAGAKPRLFAHRGASGEAPENTVAAFRRAAEAGSDYAELDVHTSRDGQVVVIHDATLERTTDGQGLVHDHTLAELQQLDAGYHFSLDGGQRFPFRDAGVRIPTLAAVLRDFPQVRFTIEIKQQDPPIEEHVIAIVRECRRTSDVLIASEHKPVLTRARALAPELATSFAATEVADFVQHVAAGQLEGYQPPGQALQIPPAVRSVPLVTPETIAVAHRIGCEVHVWTINAVEEMERLLTLGVDGIMSDFPARLLAVARGHHSS